MKRTIRGHYVPILLISLICIFCMAGISSATAEVKRDTGEKGRNIVATVNGKSIYEDQLTRDVTNRLRKFKKYGMKRNSPALVKRMQEKALDKIISEELIYQESQKLNIPDIEARISEKLKEEKGKHKSEEAFKKSLKSKKLTEIELKNSIKTMIYLDEYLKKKGLRNPEVPEEEIKDYYEDSKSTFKREEAIRASHILIMVNNDAKPGEKQGAREKAEMIRQEIINGKDFAEMARKHSEDVNAQKSDGDLGYINKGYMPPEFDEAAFALEKNMISDLVQTKFGFHIIKVVDKKPEGITPYDDVKDFITKFLQGSIAQKKLPLHIEELKKKAKIEILLNGS